MVMNDDDAPNKLRRYQPTLIAFNSAVNFNEIQ